MNTKILVAAVSEMRAAQRRYFKSRSRDDLIRSKELERAVDAIVKAAEGEQDNSTTTEDRDGE